MSRKVLTVLFFLSFLASLTSNSWAVRFYNGWADETGERIASGCYWNPEVVRLDDGTFRMYVEDHLPDGTTSNGTVIMISSDGLTWTYFGLAVMANHPAIVRLPDGRWRLYYQFNDPVSAQTGIGSAVSEDGLVFSQEEGLRLVSDESLEGAAIRHPCVVGLDEGGFRMYYDTAPATGAYRIWSAYSADGLSFSREGLRVDVTPLRSNWPTRFYAHASKPEVLKTPDGIWRMYFNCSPLTGSVFDGIGINLATSADGLVWTVKTEPELGAQTYPDGRQYSPFDVSVMVLGEGARVSLRMYYSLFTSPELGFVGQYSGIFSAIKGLDDLSREAFDWPPTQSAPKPLACPRRWKRPGSGQ